MLLPASSFVIAAASELGRYSRAVPTIVSEKKLTMLFRYRYPITHLSAFSKTFHSIQRPLLSMTTSRQHLDLPQALVTISRERLLSAEGPNDPGRQSVSVFTMGGELSKREGCFLVHFKAKQGVFAVSFIDLRFNLCFNCYIFAGYRF